MKQWTVTDVAERFEEAVYTLKRLPPVRVQGFISTWPEVIHTTLELLQADKRPLRLGPPSAEAITRMEETIQWVFYLDTEDECRLVWSKANRVPNRQICAFLGCGRTKLWQMWSVALLKITMRLNAKEKGRYHGR
jgi:hypothetical protein